jgi:ABC-type polysaccharide/polyol phosphate export permease/predicted TPR repeat methyltransferase
VGDATAFSLPATGARHPGIPDLEAARARCRRAEAAFYSGGRDDAIADAIDAFGLQPEADDILDFCAWLFSNCGRHDLAAAMYGRMLARRPLWAEGHRHLSGSLAAVGEIDAALRHATSASDIDPAAYEFALHAGVLLGDAGDHGAAARYLDRAAALAHDRVPLLLRQSATALALGEPERALALALEAFRLDPDDRAAALTAAELSMRAGDLDGAAAIAAENASRHPADPAVWRQLSAAEMLRGRMAPALAAIDAAIAAAPGEIEYQLHRGHLLRQFGSLDAAAEAFGAALALDPESRAARRGQLAAFADAGRLAEAAAIGGELLRREPGNEDDARAVLAVLERRLELFDADWRVLADAPLPERRSPRPRRWRDALDTQRRVIHALIIRETRTRFGESRLGYGWALLEPILHILLLSLVFAVLMHGRPPIGRQFFIFYYTGIIPYHVFVHSSCTLTYAISCNGSLLQLPPVTTADVIVARGILEFVTDLIVAVLLLSGFTAFGLGAMPHDMLAAGLALVAIWLFGCGCGFLNAVVSAFWKSWDKIWVQLVRLLYFCSGIFYVPAMMPPQVRDALAWNPILQAVDWFRAGFFVQYAPHWLDRGYLLTAAIVVLGTGVAVERSLRRQLYEPA